MTDFRSKPPQDQRARTSGIGKRINLESPLAGRIATNRQGAAISGGTTLTRMGIGHLGPIYYYSRKRSPYIYYEMADGSYYCAAGPVPVLHIHSERA